jgi:hypothetical protein
MQKNIKNPRRETKMGNSIEKPSRMFMSWKTVVPALAALGVGGFFFRSRQQQAKGPKLGMQVKQ